MTSKTTMFSKTLKRLPKLTKGATINQYLTKIASK
jgi:hypothetical protein